MGTMYFRGDNESPNEFSDLPEKMKDNAVQTLEQCGVESYHDWNVVGVQEDGAEVLVTVEYDSTTDTVDLTNRTVTDHGDPTDKYDHHYSVHHYEGMFGSGRIETVQGSTITLAITGRF